MHLEHLEADRLRNLRAVSLRLSPGLTVLQGRNGQGKTSLLEAVYLLATGRSFRTTRLDEAVRRDGGPLRVGGTVLSRTGHVRLGVVVDDGVRRLLVEGGEVDLASFLGRLDLVALPTERMGIVRAGPEERRRFLDRGIVGLDPGFLRDLGEYRRVLVHRNALLRQGGAHRPDLPAWDERLAAAGSRVQRRRREYAVRLAARMGEAGRALFPEGEELVLRYLPSPAEPGEEAFRQALARHRERDGRMGFTTDGPHRDDLLVELGGSDLRKYGSSGQVRLAVIALKLAKLGVLREDRGESALFLMDDFDSDLDETRTAAVAEHLHAGGFQALVATSKEDLAERLTVPLRRILVDDGTAHAA